MAERRSGCGNQEGGKSEAGPEKRAEDVKLELWNGGNGEMKGFDG
jgi:hypothetical protein